MSPNESTPSTRPPRSAVLTAVTLTLAVVAAAGVTLAAERGILPAAIAPGAAPPAGPVRGADDHGFGADGSLPDDVTPFDDEFPAVANLDPELLGVLRTVATLAADDGVAILINSGWRSPELQERLLGDAVAEYGSEEEAARWVATPETSPHVQGNAVDVGQWDATNWLSEHGAAYGLCQIYDNEPWHFELRRDAGDEGCPARYPDPTFDPRMQR